MIVALALLVMAGANPASQPVVRPSAERPVTATAVRVRRPIVPANLVQEISAPLQQAAVCAAHMELLMEKLSARDEAPDASFLMVQEYWQERLPDPEAKDAISDETFTDIKQSLYDAADKDPQQYLQGLQECVVAAARGGAMD
ncbi:MULTISPECIES: hypothetical protein [unclassified Brevundimonas]|uniref:hypothetical protein n=1 Tax=unclassified Brevundimonas TaxID=2622653 RepID=UPI0025BD5FD6|nr:MULTISPECIES: hypothetical protein [unclassified Brevundimonas]